MSCKHNFLSYQDVSYANPAQINDISPIIGLLTNHALPF